jgi:hypothetical protein
LNYSDVVKYVKLNTVEELFDLLSPFGKYKNLLDGHIFRGESSAKYKLIPSSLRLENKDKLYALSGMGMPVDNQSEWDTWQIRSEYTCLRNFFIYADNNGLRVPNIQRIRDSFNDLFGTSEIGITTSEKWIPNDIKELAALAQHYGIPTRLIDWSYDYLTALYFAASGALKKSKTNDSMVLWVLNSSYISFLYQTVKRMPIILVKPPYSENPNLYAQQGVLSYWETTIPTIHDIIDGSIRLVDRSPLDELLYKFVVDKDIEDFKQEEFNLLYRFEIPILEVHKLMDALIKMRYDAAKLFPGYGGVAKYLMDKAQINYPL